MIYTKSERTDLKYTVGKAVDSAKRRLRSTCRKEMQLCINAIGGRALNERITLSEVNCLAEQMYNDSLYYG